MSSTLNIEGSRPGISMWTRTGPSSGPRHIASLMTRARAAAGTDSSLRSWWGSHRRSAIVLSILLVVAGVAQAINMFGAPQAIDDEGVYVAQAWAIIHLHALAPYTYWYDHPPLGWVQLSLFDLLVFPFRSSLSAVAVGREAMLVVQLVNVVLLWTLARRLQVARWATAVGIAFFSLSPLAIQYHRSVYLDNIAVAWALLAFMLALSPRRRLVAFAGAGLCLGISSLSKETFLLLAPALGWQIWRTAGPIHRRYAIAAAGALFGATLSLYVLYAALKVELLPTAGHVSLWTGITYQLLNRTSSGSVFTAGTLGHRTVELWLHLDWAWPVLAILAAPLGMMRRRSRPVTCAFLLQVLMVLKPGYLPVPFVIGIMPFAALVMAIGADVVWRSVPRGRLGLGAGSVRHWLGPVALLVAVIVIGTAAIPSWASQDRVLFTVNQESPILQAETWVAANLPHNVKMIVDDTMWVDLVQDGFPRHDVVWYYKVDTDPDVEARAPLGWRSYQYVVSTQSMRTFPGAIPMVDKALTNSVPVAVFGSGSGDVVVRRIAPQGLRTQDAGLERDTFIRAVDGQKLADNPALTLSATARRQLRSGQVQLPLMVLIDSLANDWSLSITNFSEPEVQAATGQTLNQAEVAAIDGRPLAASSRVIAVEAEALNQRPPYLPTVQSTGTGLGERLLLSMPGGEGEPLPQHGDPVAITPTLSSLTSHPNPK